MGFIILNDICFFSQIFDLQYKSMMQVQIMVITLMLPLLSITFV